MASWLTMAVVPPGCTGAVRDHREQNCTVALVGHSATAILSPHQPRQHNRSSAQEISITIHVGDKSRHWLSMRGTPEEITTSRGWVPHTPAELYQRRPNREGEASATIDCLKTTGKRESRPSRVVEYRRPMTKSSATAKGISNPKMSMGFQRMNYGTRGWLLACVSGYTRGRSAKEEQINLHCKWHLLST